MIFREISKKSLIFLGLLFILIVISAFQIDYSGLRTFSLPMGLDVLKGLSQPDWSYFYNGSGEDVFSLLILTIGIAYLGTVISLVFALPLSLLSAANLWRSNARLAKVGKLLCNVLRAFPELVFAIIFVKVVGPGSFAGVLAIGLHQVGMLGKLFTEEMEDMDERLAEEVEAVGANFWQTLFFVRFPYLAPIYSSLTLNHFEIALRSAATLGLVGAGGIGAPLIFAIQARNWSKVSIILLSLVMTIFILDQVTGIIRKKLK